MVKWFVSTESGAALVEYAVALIVVTIVGGVGIMAVAGDAAGLSDISASAVDSARAEAENAVN